MRRQDIQLRLLAKRGDAEAQIKIGEAYLTGTQSIPRNVEVGLGYLEAASRHSRKEAVQCIARNLQLHELLQHDQIDALASAAVHDNDARLKLASLYLVRGEVKTAADLLAGCPGLPAKVAQAFSGSEPPPPAVALRAIRSLEPAALVRVVILEARNALSGSDVKRAIRILECIADYSEEQPLELHQTILSVVRQAEEKSLQLGSLGIAQIEQSLQRCAAQGDQYACHTLGRAMAGLRCGDLEANRLVHSPNLRKSAALLLRAADGGIVQAWLDLYRICSDYRSSVGNAMMAQFCLDKAASQGNAEAERRLGAIELRDATQIDGMERAVSLLHRAASKGDSLASRLLDSLVFPVAGNEADAASAIAEVHRTAPLLAARLRLARSFGLTKLEALSVNPATGVRPWGLVVEKNPFIVKMRLSEPRVIPAVNQAALNSLEWAARLYSTGQGQLPAAEGPLRARSVQQRRMFDSLGIHDDLFFATASSSQRDALRIGTKWAQRERHTLQMALAH
jgi:TPR repeat protein